MIPTGEVYPKTTEEAPRAPYERLILAVFVLGLVSAVCFRAIIVFQRIAPSWVRPVWYVGTVGYIVFFFYRFDVSRRRKDIIARHGLIEKLTQNACLTPEDRRLTLKLLSSLKGSLEEINYLVIFLLSLAAIATDLVLSAHK